MRVLKYNGAFASKAIDVWRLSLRMTTEHTDPIIQIINSDEQNVGLLLCLQLRRKNCHQQQNANNPSCGMQHRRLPREVMVSRSIYTKNQSGSVPPSPSGNTSPRKMAANRIDALVAA